MIFDWTSEEMIWVRYKVIKKEKEINGRKRGAEIG